MTANILGSDGLIVLIVAVVVLFGGSQLPKLAKSLGSAQSEFKKGLAEGKKGDDTESGTDTPASGDTSAAKDSDKPSAASG